MIISPFSSSKFNVTVIGAGPAGVASISCLLDHLYPSIGQSFFQNYINSNSSNDGNNVLNNSNHIPSSQLDYNSSPSILWIDPSFKGGRLNQYDSVPSNTKVKYFSRFYNSSSIFSSFHDYCQTKNLPSEDPIHEIKKLCPEKGSILRYPLEMIQKMTFAIEKYFHSFVKMERDTVKQLTWNDQVCCNQLIFLLHY